MFHVKHQPAIPDPYGLDVSRETFDRLSVFVEMLGRWNARINLVSAGDLAVVWTRHVADSLQLAQDLPDTATFTDLGSGGGFPGLILAIARNARVTLVEADHRKASFLREAARATSVQGVVLAERIERAELPPAAFVTARALAPLPRLLEWSSRFLRPDGVCLFLKGRGTDGELTAAAAGWHMKVSRRPSRTDPDGVILRLSEIRRVRESDRTSGR